MRNYDTPVRAIRHKVYVEVAKAGFESTDETLIHDIEAIPYNIVEEKAKYRESIYRERAVASERVRLAMGLSLRPENKAVHLTDGLAASNIDEKYYEPPLMQVIPSACAACPPNKYIVSNMCRGCVAHPCMQACPKGAISDKSQIFQLAHALRGGEKIIAIVAPAYISQFGDDVTPGKFKTALQVLGFSDVHEVAFGADVGAIAEAHHYAEKVATGELPFLLTSCCPSWSMMAKKFFPTMIDNISQELTPMVATARKVKQEHPDAKVVFVGPCASKKLEAMRRTVRSDVDFVLTFEELDAMFDAREIDPASFEEDGSLHDATAAGRGYAVAGGVAGAIEACLKEYYPDVPVHIEHAESLAECKKVLALAKAGKLKGCMIEGMACPGGCMGGAGTNVPVAKSSKELKKFLAGCTKKLPPKELVDIELK